MVLIYLIEKKEEAEQRARELLCRVGLQDRETAMPHQLSGGQKQRIAIVRTLAMNPDIILLSGGVAEQGDLLVAPIREYVRTYSLYNTRNTPVRIAELSSKAGVIGAAALILNGN